MAPWHHAGPGPLPPDHPDQPFRPDACGDLAPLRQALSAAGYAETAVTATVGITHPAQQMDVPAMLHRTAGVTPYNTLFRLFILRQVLPANQVRAAVAPMDLQPLIDCGLLKRVRGGLRAEAALVPVGDVLVVHDFWRRMTGRPHPANHVLGIGNAAITLANMTPRRPVGAVLDVGAGCGIQAMLAARHAGAVTGTDVNRRALSFAEMSRRLNGLANVELRLGSLYEPVKDERFDLIVCNPPFVISPESRYVFRDGGRPGDLFAQEVIRGAPPRLNEGGFCVVICNWYHRRGEDWSQRPGEWVAALGCDAWIVRLEAHDPIYYASSWLHQEGDRDSPRYARRLAEWLSYYRTMDVEGLDSGVIVLRRRCVPANWIRADQRECPSGPCGRQVEETFAAEDLLRSLDDQTKLLDMRFRRADAQKVEQTFQAPRGAWRLTSSVLKLTDGFRCEGSADPGTISLLAGCDGTRTLREALAPVAQQMARRLEDVAQASIAVVRELLRHGHLVPVT
jgi:hypothetical protein